MKTILAYLVVFFAAIDVIAADDPYGAALGLLPQQHSHKDASVERLTLDQLEQIAMQANPELRVAARKLVHLEASRNPQ